MSNPRLNRQIGYAKPSEAQTPMVESKKPAMTADEIEKAEIEKPVKILKWLQEHKDFKVSSMCKELGINKGNFSTMIKKGEIRLPIALLLRIEEKLKKYGYAA